MKKRIRKPSLTTKSILILLLCAILFMFIVSPIIQKITFDIFNPYLEENIIMKTSDGAAYMSMFLARSNPKLRSLTKYNKDFLTSVNNLTNGTITPEKFSSSISESIEPFTTEFFVDDENTFSATSYPIIYIENKGVFCNENVNEVALNITESDWFEGYLTSKYKIETYAPTFYQEENGERQEYFSFVHFGYSDFDNDIKYYAILVTKLSDILPLWEGVLELGIDDFGFLGTGYEILYKNIENSHWELDWIKDNLASGRQHYVVTNEVYDKTCYASLVSYETEQLRYFMQVPEDVYSNLFLDSNYLIQVIFFLSIAVIVIIFFIFLKQIFKRLAALADKMAVVQNGNYNVTLDDSSSDEIGQLASAFNIMTSKIQENIDKLVENEKREKMLQYNLMVSSIDPHFIYNTLNTSTRLAELGRNDEVVIVNDALINCLKDNLKMKNFNSYDTVANELDTVEQYITIQNYLCDNTVSLETSINEADMQLKIPKFLLQPMVENSILHGIVMNVDNNGNLIPGRIGIDIKNIGERIKIRISDNGVGMSPETIDKYFNTDENVILNEEAHLEHIGVLNMRTRLSYLYNNNYSISVKSELGKGTEIVIEIPIN